jgi:hypothetical protein
MLTQDDKKQISDIVVDVIQDVVMPAFETLNKKIDKVSDRLGGVETRVEQMDRKLDIVTEKVFTHDSQLVNHEKRLKKVEQIVSSPS